jgi:hypothetical protein
MSTNPKHEVYNLAFSQLNIFLNDYQECQSRSVELDIQILRKILRFLLKKKSLDIDQSRLFAIHWLESFLKFFNEDLLKETAFDDSKEDDPFFYGSTEDVAPTFGALEEEKVKSNSENEETKDVDLEKSKMKDELGSNLFPEMLQCILYYINTENTDIGDKISKCNF